MWDSHWSDLGNVRFWKRSLLDWRRPVRKKVWTTELHSPSTSQSAPLAGSKPERALWLRGPHSSRPDSPYSLEWRVYSFKTKNQIQETILQFHKTLEAGRRRHLCTCRWSSPWTRCGRSRRRASAGSSWSGCRSPAWAPSWTPTPSQCDPADGGNTVRPSTTAGNTTVHHHICTDITAAAV